MSTKYKASEECISAEDAIVIGQALGEYIANKRKEGVSEKTIKNMENTNKAIRRVLDHASLEYDDICFIVNIGTRYK